MATRCCQSAKEIVARFRFDRCSSAALQSGRFWVVLLSRDRELPPAIVTMCWPKPRLRLRATPAKGAARRKLDYCYLDALRRGSRVASSSRPVVPVFDIAR